MCAIRFIIINLKKDNTIYRKDLFSTILLLLIATSTIQAQGVGAEVGYKYNRNSLGYLGAGVSLSTINSRNQDLFLLNLGGGMNYGVFNSKSKFSRLAMHRWVIFS